ncbi:PIN domain-containing protein [Cellulosimicrobium funkei]|uniref:PIN domain-containing protein n=1 Tax=Cellulosimicrobium funkei TaxID=264251 RepID=UPI0037DCC4D9
MITRVLPDANVLYSRTLRDWLFLTRNTAKGMYTVITTEDILAEVVYNYRRDDPSVDGGIITRLANSLRKNVDEILGDYPSDPQYSASDPNDQHVHAAACTSGVDMLVTSDQGLLELDDDRYEVMTPDDFFCFADESQPAVIRSVVLEQSAYWRDSSLTEYLERAGCPEFAKRVKARLAEVLRLPVGKRQTRILR